MYLLLTGRAALSRSAAGEDPRTQSLLRWCAQNGCVTLVQCLFEEGGLDRNGAAGAVALMGAAEEGRTNVVAMLLKSGMREFDRKSGQYGRAPLAAAAAGGHGEVARMLLESGKVDREARDGEGRTPLALAAMSGSVEVVGLLLGCEGICVDVKDDVGRTPLSLAVEGGNLGVFEVLFRAGADPSLSDAEL